MKRRNFIKAGALWVPTILTARKSLAQKLFDPNLGLGAASAGLSALNSEWLTRILAAGGARPSDATFAANDVWYAALVTAGIDTRIKCCNTYAPDNLIASITPLIQGNGSASWGNHNFTASELTVNGLKGNGSSMYLTSGFNPGTTSGMGNGSNHMSVIVSADDRTSAQAELGGSSSATDAWHILYHYIDNKSYITNCSGFLDAGTVLGASDNPGYMCNSRTTTTRVDMFFAKTGTAHSSVYNNTGNVGGNAFGVTAMPVHASNELGVIANFSKKRLAFISVGLSLTSTQSSALFSASNALRTAYGGGNV